MAFGNNSILENNRNTTASGSCISCDVLVFGATPCGISAAIAAARYGRSVALVSAGAHLGGLMSSGLSITDLRFEAAFGGIFRQFAEAVLAYYRDRYGADSPQVRDSNGGIWFEPHVAEAVFERLLAAEPGIAIFRQYRLLEASCGRGRAGRATFQSRERGEELRVEAGVVIDGSYEGDLAAAAGVSYRIGREGRDEYGEPYAGFIFLRNPGLQVLEGSTGEGDRRVQAYNYRLILTNRDDLRVLPQKPDGYDRTEYAPLIEEARKGSFACMNDLVRLAPIPNGKFNANNRPVPRSLDYPEANTDYPDGDEACRKRIIDRYRTYMTGLLWFAQNDPELPEALKAETRQWGFCKDEFADNGHIPYELYVREARRIVGVKTFTANDAFLARGGERTPVHEDAVAVGDYHVDSHLVQRKRPEWPQYEGHVYLRPLSKPAQIPYGVMVPVGVEGLLVPGALSATHLGFSVLRMEPPWMALGQAAGTAAHLALLMGVPPSGVPVSGLQRLLLQAGQVIAFFYDIPGPDPIWERLNRPAERTRPDAVAWETPEAGAAPGMQYFAAKGWFPTYYARPKDPVTRSEAALWLARFLELEGGLPPTPAVCDFADVRPSDPDYEAISILCGHRIVEGWQGSPRFFPHAAVSRSDAVRWIVNIKLREAGWQLGSPGPSRFSDVPDADPMLPYYALLDDLGVLPPSWGGRSGLRPLVYIDREQFCDLLYEIHFASWPKSGMPEERESKKR